MTSTKGMYLTLIIVLLSPMASNADPISWGLFPDSQTVVIGQAFRLDLVVAGLGESMAPSLRTFDVDITFSDTFAIDPDSVVFGTFLGDPNDAAKTQTISTLIGTEVLFLREESFLTAAALDAIQGSSFTLATMTFMASEAGTYVFAGDDCCGGLFLNDDNRPVTPGVSIASVTVRSVPEPSTLALLGVGLLAIALVRHKKV